MEMPISDQDTNFLPSRDLLSHSKSATNHPISLFSETRTNSAINPRIPTVRTGEETKILWNSHIMLYPVSQDREDLGEDDDNDDVNSFWVSTISEARARTEEPREQRLGGGIVGNGGGLACFFLSCTNRSEKGTVVAFSGTGWKSNFTVPAEKPSISCTELDELEEISKGGSELRELPWLEEGVVLMHRHRSGCFRGREEVGTLRGVEVWREDKWGNIVGWRE